MLDIVQSRTIIQGSNLQFLGATCLFLATKVHESESCPPAHGLDDFVDVCADAYGRSQLLELERTVLRELDFDIGVPIAFTFLRLFAQACNCSMKVESRARWLVKHSVMSYEISLESESLIAASALSLAASIEEQSDIWNVSLVEFTSYKKEDLLLTEDRLQIVYDTLMEFSELPGCRDAVNGRRAGMAVDD